jgi:3-oxoacyl-[acyl-carrier-protein] synthase II
MGLVTPLGVGREASWRALTTSQSAVTPAGAPAPMLEGESVRTHHLALSAVQEALDDAGVRSPLGERCAVLVSGSKPIFRGANVLSPESIPHEVARTFGAQGGAMNLSAACATGLMSVMAAAEWIREGRCDTALAGAAESSFHPLYVAGFQRMGVLSKTGRVSPFDVRRDGFIMGEGSAAFYLETEAAARRRGARIYGALRGWAFGCDAHDAVRLNGEGRLMARTLSRALAKAAWKPSALDYLNAHGTATPLNDALEARALAGLFSGGSAPLVSSTKGATGHLLGATGAVELGFSLLSMRDGLAPPTLNLEDPETDRLDFVPARARRHDVRRAASISFGFGGSLAALVMEKI